MAFLHPTYVLAKHHVRFHQLEGLANLLKTVAKHGLNELGFSQSIEAVPENRLSSHIFFCPLGRGLPSPIAIIIQEFEYHRFGEFDFESVPPRIISCPLYSGVRYLVGSLLG